MEVEMRIRGLLLDPVTNTPIVILKDANSDTVLPIWVGVYEANAIALEIEKPRGVDDVDLCTEPLGVGDTEIDRVTALDLFGRGIGERRSVFHHAVTLAGT